jgi:hypothetical protein
MVSEREKCPLSSVVIVNYNGQDQKCPRIMSWSYLAWIQQGIGKKP